MRVGVMGEVMRGGLGCRDMRLGGAGVVGGRGGDVWDMRLGGAGVIGGWCLLGYAGRWRGGARHGRFEPSLSGGWWRL